MKEFIIYIGQSAVCIGIFFLIYRIFLRSSTFFRFNRAFLLLGLTASFIIPMIRFSYDVVLPISVSIAVESTATQAIPETTEINIWLLLSIIYMAGIMIQLLRNFTSYRKLIGMIRSGILTKTDQYRIIDNPQIKSPFTVLNCIIINTMNMTEIEKDVILKHEITHISQKHWIDLLCSECALLLQWFNPLMWLYVSSLKENHEFLADKAVIDAGISPAVYQATLINQRFQGPVFSFSNSFNYPNQLNRLFMIKKAKTSPWRRAAALALIPSFGLFFWASATPHYIFAQPEQVTYAILDNPTTPIVVEGYRNSGDNSDKTSKQTKNSIITSQTNKKPETVYFTPPIIKKDPLIIIDGKENNKRELDKLAPSTIDNVSVLKDKSAIDTYGSKGKDGVIIVTTKKGASASPVMINVASPTSEENPNASDKASSQKDEDFKMKNIKADNPLFIIDGKEVSNEIFQAIDPNKIERVDVLKDSKATALYGTRGKGGVIMVTLKK